MFFPIPKSDNAGYWAYLSQEELLERNEPFLTGQLPFLERAIGWAKKYNLKAIIDLHGAPGGQNGFDNRYDLFKNALIFKVVMLMFWNGELETPSTELWTLSKE